MRRALAFVVLLLTFRLSMATPDATCTHQDVSRMTDAADMAAMHHGVSHDMQHDSPSRPRQQDGRECCTALASCSVTMIHAAATIAVAPCTANADPAIENPARALSRLVAPDTPPPKA